LSSAQLNSLKINLSTISLLTAGKEEKKARKGEKVGRGEKLRKGGRGGGPGIV
jgi:hypothetical protein